MIHRLSGTRLYERTWSSRGIDAVRQDFANIDYPHRRWLVEQFARLSPFESVLEIGCGYGPNLQLLEGRFPGLSCHGIDISPNAVREGNARFASLGNKNIHISVGKAVLLYVGPDKIEKVIRELIRVSRRALLLVEFHDSNPQRDPVGLGLHTYDGWVRDYEVLLSKFFSIDRIQVTKFPPGLRSAGRWPLYGHLITVML